MDWLLLITYAAPVALAAIGEVVVQRSGVINIALEGCMLAAAFFAMAATFATGSPWAGLAAGIVAGSIVAAVFGLFVVRAGSDQVVVGTAVNLLVLGATSTLYRAQFGQSGKLVTVPKLPSAFGFDPVLGVLFLSVPFVAWLIHRTNWGLAVRASGEYPKAAEAAGFSVFRLRLVALLLGGVMAGLAGAYLSLGIAGTFAENMTAGRGFVAIAMVTFGRWKAPWAFAAALVIGVAESLQFRFQALGFNVPYQLMIALPYLVALVVLAIAGKGASAPAALGQPYSKRS